MTKERKTELRRAIAEALPRYRIEFENDKYLFYSSEADKHPRIVKARSIDEAWEIVISHPRLAHEVFNWPRDLNAASELMPVGCSLNRVDSDEWPGPWECTKVTDYFTMENVTRYGDTPEMAICEWYVAARDAEAVSDG